MIYQNPSNRDERRRVAQRQRNRIRKHIVVSAPFPCLVRYADSFSVAMLVHCKDELLLEYWLLRDATEQEARAILNQIVS
jgi:hypothetical protein